MHAKTEIILITFCFLIGYGCAGSRRIARDSGSERAGYKAENLLKQVSNNNLTNRDFVLSRIRVKLYTEGNRNSFSGFLRFDNEGAVLLSVRTVAGIEAARIFIDGDSIKINDRINRIYYHGATANILRKYGVEWKDIGLMFGDIPNLDLNSRNKDIYCVDGFWEANEVLGANRVSFKIDCEEKKLSLINIGESIGTPNIVGNYSDFMKTGDVKYPSRIVLRSGIGFELEIDIEKIEIVEDPMLRFRRIQDYESRVLK